MTVIIIVLLVVLLAGGGYGYRSGYIGHTQPISFLLLVVLVLLLLALFGGPRAGLW